MKTEINVKFEGTLADLSKFLDNTFKDPSGLVLNVNVCVTESNNDPFMRAAITRAKSFAAYTNPGWSRAQGRAGPGASGLTRPVSLSLRVLGVHFF